MVNSFKSVFVLLLSAVALCTCSHASIIPSPPPRVLPLDERELAKNAFLFWNYMYGNGFPEHVSNETAWRDPTHCLIGQGQRGAEDVFFLPGNVGGDVTGLPPRLCSIPRKFSKVLIPTVTFGAEVLEGEDPDQLLSEIQDLGEGLKDRAVSFHQIMIDGVALIRPACHVVTQRRMLTYPSTGLLGATAGCYHELMLASNRVYDIVIEGSAFSGGFSFKLHYRVYVE